METNGLPHPWDNGAGELIRRDRLSGGRLVLLGTQGRPEDEIAIRTLWTCCGILDPARVLLRVVHVLTVPMTAPLDVALPQAEQASDRILRRAQIVATMAGMAVETAILRGRSVAEALVDDARRTGASAIAVRLRSRETVGAHVLLSLTMRTLLRSAPCPIIIVHLPHVKEGLDAGEELPRFYNGEQRPARLIHGSAAYQMPEKHARGPNDAAGSPRR